MFSLSRKRAIVRLSVIGVFVATVLSLLGFFVVDRINYNVGAAAGDSASIDPGQQVPYGSEGWATNRFDVIVNGTTYNGFCANPQKSTPSGSYTVNSAGNAEWANMIKLLIYIYENNNSITASARAAIYDYPSSYNDYSWTHAIIGVIYADDYWGASSEAGLLNDKVDLLRSYVRNDADAWAVAKNYVLYYTDGDNLQDIVWIEGPNLIHGNIKVQKCDSEVGEACSRGGRWSLAGITFELYNNSGEKVYNDRTGKVYANREKIATATTDSNGKASFDVALTRGTYAVKETATNRFYALNDSEQSLTINIDGETETASISDHPKRGDIKFVKQDSTNNHIMSDVLFSITAVDENNQPEETHFVVSDSNGIVDTSLNKHSNSTNGYDPLYELEKPITYLGYGTWFGLDTDGNQIPVNDDVGALPYGTYLIQEMRCPSNIFCYNVKDQKVVVDIDTDGQVLDLGDWDNACAEMSLGTTAVDNKDGDKFIELSQKAEIKDTVHYCVREDLEYTITGVLLDKATGEEILINGEPVTESVTINPTEPCGEIDMIFTFDASKLAGKEVVVSESLLYKGEEILVHDDLDDEGQTVEIISLGTYAVNNATSEKTLPYDEDVEIKDTVMYCLKPGREYTVKGILMDKTTKNGVLSNSEPVEAEIKFTPEKACGEVEMFYKLNTADLGGRELVIFESLYIDDTLILEHNDFENASETVSVELPAPDTGSLTKNTNKANSTGNTIFIVATAVISTSGYIITRLIARKRFLTR